MSNNCEYLRCKIVKFHHHLLTTFSCDLSCVVFTFSAKLVIIRFNVFCLIRVFGYIFFISPCLLSRYLKEREICVDYFSSWTEQDQIEFVEELLKCMQHHQHGTVNAFLKPMLQRDFISLLPKKVRLNQKKTS